MRPQKWKCANECRLLTIGKIEVTVCKGRGTGRRRVGVGGEGVGVGGEE